MNPLLPWKRVRSALLQYACGHAIDPNRVESVMDILPSLIAMSGQFSHSRRVARNVGKILLAGDRVRVVVPVCPAYTYRHGIYTYRGLGEGVPLLVKTHVPFLQTLQSFLPGSEICFLLADQEATVPELCRAIGIDSREFSRRIKNSVVATRRLVEPEGWEVSTMTDFVPGFLGDVAGIARRLRADPQWRVTLRRESASRESVYQQIGYPRAKYFERTVQTAAQYTRLGTFAMEQGVLIVNHTTLNLAWYVRASAGFLHNPVRVYGAEEPAVPLELAE